LREREDRARAAAEEFHRLGLCRKVLFYRPSRHQTNPIAGIWESHRTVLSHALEHGYRSALVLEDDVLFSRWFGARTSRRLNRVIRQLPADWNLFYLGHWPMRMRFISLNLVSTSSACTHAYVASDRLMRLISERPYVEQAPTPGVGRGIDSVFLKLPGAYAFFPMVVTQSTSPSDHIPERQKRKIRRVHHIVTKTRAREWLLSKLMRPAELVQAFRAAVVLVAVKLLVAFRGLQSGTTSP
jgi:GR25 family glycosyltransferase involved in LPS biosynthesis